MPNRPHHIRLERWRPRPGVVMVAVGVWLALGLLSQAAFQFVG